MKILSFDVSGNYSSISFLNNEEVNTFTQTHDRKERPDWDKLFESIGFESNEGFDVLNGIAFACGPGSYTALRITASFLKAIAEVKKLIVEYKLTKGDIRGKAIKQLMGE